MEIEKLKMQDGLVRKEIENLATDEKSPIYDGIINYEEYINTKPKILWLLKEAYDKDNNGDGNWDLTEVLGNDNVYSNFLSNKENRSKLTWYPIIYSSYCILNKIKCYDDVDFIDDKPEIADVLKQIAFININKLAGVGTTNMSNLRAVFEKNKFILKKQIDIFNPDIIIGCNTLKIYFNLLDLESAKCEESKLKTKYYLKNDKLYIDAYHPSRIGIARYKFVNEEYIDDIIEISNNYF